MGGPYPGLLAGGLSSDGYLDRRLRPLDSEHYSAAGLLPYRRREGGKVELLLPKERPWNSFTQDYDPLSWNLFGGKRIPRKERSIETTAVRSFLEVAGEVDGAPDQEKLYSMMQKSFTVWYPMGKFALVVVEVPESELTDFPERYSTMKEQAGPEQEYRILPMGIKKWNKMIPEIAWVPAEDLLAESAKSEAEDLLAESAKSEVSDLLGCMAQISSFKEFLDGSVDPEKELPERPPAPPPSKNEGTGNGKGFSGKGRWPKGGGKGGFGGGGFGGGGCGPCFGKGAPGYMMAKGACGPGMMMAAKGAMGPMMYTAKGMPMMPPMVYPPFQAPAQPQQAPSEELQRQMYGEQLYVLVQPLSPSPYLAQKITGMLLELPHNELVLNLTNPEELQRRVKEALEVLREDGVA